MKTNTAFLITLSFLLPVGIVTGSHFLRTDADSKTITGTLNYFYAPS